MPNSSKIKKKALQYKRVHETCFKKIQDNIGKDIIKVGQTAKEKIYG